MENGSTNRTALTRSFLRLRKKFQSCESLTDMKYVDWSINPIQFDSMIASSIFIRPRNNYNMIKVNLCYLNNYINSNMLAFRLHLTICICRLRQHNSYINK